MRGAPSLSATTLEPSFTTTRLMPGAYLPPRAGLRRARRSGGVGIERDARDLDLIARLEALRLQRLQHADPSQPALQIRHRVLVVDLVARQQSLDAPPLDDERARSEPLHLEARAGGRPEHHVLGQLLLARDRPRVDRP